MLISVTERITDCVAAILRRTTCQYTSSRFTIENEDISTLAVSALRLLRLAWRDVEASVHKTLVTPNSSPRSRIPWPRVFTKTCTASYKPHQVTNNRGHSPSGENTLFRPALRIIRIRTTNRSLSCSEEPKRTEDRSHLCDFRHICQSSVDHSLR